MVMTHQPLAPSTVPQRDAYLVLGMHRSGTSALTQILAIAGATLPDNVMPGDEHNAKGYFEPWRISVFNDDRLVAGGGAWNDPFLHPYVPLVDEADWTARALALFREEYRNARHPLLKDPRVSVLMPLWRSVLQAEGLDARCVIPIRHPLAVAASLAKRDKAPVQLSVLLWMTYMVAAEAGSRGMSRAFVDYDGLVADWRTEVEMMETALGGKLPRLTAAGALEIDGFLSPDLRHNSPQGDLLALGEVGQTAQDVLTWLQAARRGEGPSNAPLERAEQLISRLQSQFGGFLSPMISLLHQTRVELATTEAKLDLATRHGANRERELLDQAKQMTLEHQKFHAALDGLLAAR